MGRRKGRKEGRKEGIITQVKRKVSKYRNPKMAQMLKIEDKDIKATIVYKF